MRNHPFMPLRRDQRGFTLMELMIVLALAGVILGLAIPNFRDFIRNGRLTSGANDLLMAFTLARTEAIKRQLPVVVCATASPQTYPPVCSGSWTGASTGWVVWVDANNNWVPDNDPLNEPVLLAHEALDSSVTRRSDFSGRVKFLSTGFAAAPAGGFTNTANIAMCDSRGTGSVGSNGSAARALRFTQTGRVRVTRDVADVTAALTAIGAACP